MSSLLSRLHKRRAVLVSHAMEVRYILTSIYTVTDRDIQTPLIPV